EDIVRVEPGQKKSGRAVEKSAAEEIHGGEARQGAQHQEGGAGPGPAPREILRGQRGVAVGALQELGHALVAPLHERTPEPPRPAAPRPPPPPAAGRGRAPPRKGARPGEKGRTCQSGYRPPWRIQRPQKMLRRGRA